jgi:hypothetical protein
MMELECFLLFKRESSRTLIFFKIASFPFDDEFIFMKERIFRINFYFKIFFLNSQMNI